MMGEQTGQSELEVEEKQSNGREDQPCSSHRAHSAAWHPHTQILVIGPTEQKPRTRTPPPRSRDRTSHPWGRA